MARVNEGSHSCTCHVLPTRLSTSGMSHPAKTVLLKSSSELCHLCCKMYDYDYLLSYSYMCVRFPLFAADVTAMVAYDPGIILCFH